MSAATEGCFAGIAIFVDDQSVDIDPTPAGRCQFDGVRVARSSR